MSTRHPIQTFFLDPREGSAQTITVGTDVYTVYFGDLPTDMTDRENRPNAKPSICRARKPQHGSPVVSRVPAIGESAECSVLEFTLRQKMGIWLTMRQRAGTIYVLEGIWRCDGTDLKAGDIVRVASGQSCTLSTKGASEHKALLTVVPGGVEGFAAAIVAFRGSERMTKEQLESRYGIRLFKR